MNFPEKVLPKVKNQIWKQFLNKKVPNYYSKFSEWFYYVKKKLKSDFQKKKNQFFQGGDQGFFVRKIRFFLDVCRNFCHGKPVVLVTPPDLANPSLPPPPITSFNLKYLMSECKASLELSPAWFLPKIVNHAVNIFLLVTFMIYGKHDASKCHSKVVWEKYS